MKTLLLAGLIAVAGVMGTQSPVSAQKGINSIADKISDKEVPQQQFDLEHTMVNSRAMRDFKRTFSTVDDEKRYKYDQGYMAVFTNDDARFRVEYDNRGNWTGTQKEYTETKLDRNIRTMVRSAYFDYAITWVKEITLPRLFTNPVYIIYIEDEKSFKSICVYDGEIKVLDELVKS